MDAAGPRNRSEIAPEKERDGKPAGLIAAVLFGVGFASFIFAYGIYHRQRDGRVPRPDATGDTGVVLVFAQTPSGPVRLEPGRARALSRPQDLVFQTAVNGTGPRHVRIELTSGGRRTVMHEERIEGPKPLDSLPYLLHLDDRAPDDMSVVVTVEAPHTRELVLVYPLRLGP